MVKKHLTELQKKVDIDLNIIFITTLVALGIIMGLQGQLNAFIKNENIPVLLRAVISAFAQFAVAGLGITIVSILRKESFLSYGLRWKGTILSIFLSGLCFMPYLTFLFATKQIEGYSPLSVWITEYVLASGFLNKIVGMLLVATAWGFFEGFNYVVISDKINKRYPSKNEWLDWGAITCAILCILIHGGIGVTTEGIIEMLTVLLLVYGMLMVKKLTDNAWGCIFIFVFLWNAF